jgi:hypothetical protein
LVEEKIDKGGNIFLKNPDKNTLKLKLPIVIFGDHEPLIKHSCKCNYMNEIDDLPILSTNWDNNLNFLSASTFSKIACFVNIPKTEKLFMDG